MTDFTSIVECTLYNDDKPGDFVMTPAIAYFCFDSVDFDFEKEIIEEDIYSDIKKEKRHLKRRKRQKLQELFISLQRNKREHLNI